MLKKIYSKTGNVDLHVSDIETFKDYMKFIIPGTKIKWVGEKKRYTCIARSDNFIIVSKPFNLKKNDNGDSLVQYSIFDLTSMQCNKDNLVFSFYNYGEETDCKEALECLERSLIPWEERFNKIEETRGVYKLIPKYLGADNTLEISHRGRANIEDIIDEIWVDAFLHK